MVGNLLGIILTIFELQSLKVLSFFLFFEDGERRVLSIEVIFLLGVAKDLIKIQCLKVT